MAPKRGKLTKLVPLQVPNVLAPEPYLLGSTLHQLAKEITKKIVYKLPSIAQPKDIPGISENLEPCTLPVKKKIIKKKDV